AIAITTTLTSSSERIWPTSSRPTTSLAVSRSSKGFRPMSTSATHGQKSQLAASATRSSKCRDQTVSLKEEMTGVLEVLPGLYGRKAFLVGGELEMRPDEAKPAFALAGAKREIADKFQFLLG